MRKVSQGIIPLIGVLSLIIAIVEFIGNPASIFKGVSWLIVTLSCILLVIIYHNKSEEEGQIEEQRDKLSQSIRSIKLYSLFFLIVLAYVVFQGYHISKLKNDYFNEVQKNEELEKEVVDRPIIIDDTYQVPQSLIDSLSDQIELSDSLRKKIILVSDSIETFKNQQKISPFYFFSDKKGIIITEFPYPGNESLKHSTSKLNNSLLNSLRTIVQEEGLLDIMHLSLSCREFKNTTNIKTYESVVNYAYDKNAELVVWGEVASFNENDSGRINGSLNLYISITNEFFTRSLSRIRPPASRPKFNKIGQKFTISFNSENSFRTICKFIKSLLDANIRGADSTIPKKKEAINLLNTLLEPKQFPHVQLDQSIKVAIQMQQAWLRYQIIEKLPKDNKEVLDQKILLDKYFEKPDSDVPAFKHYVQAKVQMYFGKIDEAVKELEQARDIDEFELVYRQDLAIAYQRQTNSSKKSLEELNNYRELILKEYPECHEILTSVAEVSRLYEKNNNN